MAAAHDIIEWVRQHGEVMAISRLSVRMMEATLKEKLSIRNIDASTTCSQDFLDALRKEAGVVVGKPCPDMTLPRSGSIVRPHSATDGNRHVS